MIFHKLNLDTNEILDAASTKWNFSPFRPGLVGGHCIGVDPYYLTYQSLKFGYIPKIILSGRQLNDKMHINISKIIINYLKTNKIINKNILVMGFSFKSNINDCRNTRVVNLINYFLKRGFKVDLYDPLIETKIIKDQFKINLIK
mgnify:CR=1 FL=1